MFDSKKPTVQLLGRWQPWHDGHTELFKRAHAKTGQVCIMIRDMPNDKDNPYAMGMRRNTIIETLSKAGFKESVDYIITVVPNIVDITYGRKVGYSITQEHLGEEIENISATEIRNQK
jgi:nicotinamide mononucleotide adenylyltransferase